MSKIIVIGGGCGSIGKIAMAEKLKYDLLQKNFPLFVVDYLDVIERPNFHSDLVDSLQMGMGIIKKDEVLVAEIIQNDKIEIPRRVKTYKVVNQFLFQDVQLGNIVVSPGNLFHRLLDEPENFSDGFLLFSEQNIIDSLNFEPYEYE